MKASDHLRALQILLGLGFVLAFAPAIRAEELVLKDGKKLSDSVTVQAQKECQC